MLQCLNGLLDYNIQGALQHVKDLPLSAVRSILYMQ